jgi:hypothetical protein
MEGKQIMRKIKETKKVDQLMGWVNHAKKVKEILGFLEIEGVEVKDIDASIYLERRRSNWYSIPVFIEEIRFSRAEELKNRALRRYPKMTIEYSAMGSGKAEFGHPSGVTRFYISGSSE